MANIIIKGKTKFGYNRSEQEANLRKEGMSSLSEEQLDKCKYIEKKQRDIFGLKESFIDQGHLGGNNGIKTED